MRVSCCQTQNMRNPKRSAPIRAQSESEGRRSQPPGQSMFITQSDEQSVQRKTCLSNFLWPRANENLCDIHAQRNSCGFIGAENECFDKHCEFRQSFDVLFRVKNRVCLQNYATSSQTAPAKVGLAARRWIVLPELRLFSRLGLVDESKVASRLGGSRIKYLPSTHSRFAVVCAPLPI